MTYHRIRLDNRADHNALMAQLCRQAAAGLAQQIALTKDPIKREALHQKMLEHEAQSERHHMVAEQLERRAKALHTQFQARA
jgi:hypothetical protein